MSRKTGRFERSDRLRDSRDFRRIMRRGRRQSDAKLVVVVTPRWKKPISSDSLSESNDLSLRSGSRVGITVSRKVGGAVVRNRFKRRVREWFRVHRHEINGNLDLVVIAKRSAADLSSRDLAAGLARLTGIMAPKHHTALDPRGN